MPKKFNLNNNGQKNNFFSAMDKSEGLQEQSKYMQAEKMFLSYDIPQAVNLLKELVNDGNVKAKALLGLIYIEEMGGIQGNIEKGADLLTNNGDDLVSAIYCFTHYQGNDMDFIHNISTLIDDEINSLVESNDPLELSALADYYADNDNLNANDELAFQYYMKAAQLGYWRAMTKCGLGYLTGKGTMVDPTKGIEFLRKAAMIGDSLGAWFLGEEFVKGVSVNQNFTQAITFYQIAARQNDVDASQRIADLYFIQNDFFTALQCYRDIWNKYATIASALGIAAIYSGLFEAEDNPLNLNLDTMEQYIEHVLKIEPDQSYACILASSAYIVFDKNLDEKSLNTAEEILNLGYSNKNSTDTQGILLYEYLNNTFNDEFLTQIRGFINDKREKLKNGCFITTAVCGSFGKTDDCYELTQFRGFRDHWLALQDDGKSIIKEYYEIAPKIVNKINSLPNSHDIYLMIWNRYLKKCLYLIETGDNVKCKDIYVNMVIKLKDKYLTD